MKNKLPISDLTSDVDKKEAEILIQKFEQDNKDKYINAQGVN
jgi:hypothetical protein